MKLQEKILMLRKSRGLSQEELSEKLNVSRQAVSRWETGTALPDAANLLELSRLFGVTADYLLNDDYRSDSDVPAVKTTAIIASRRLRRIAGICMAAFGLFGNFVIYILSRMIKVMVPYISYTADGTKMYTWRADIKGYSYKYFIQTRNLELLTAFFFLLVIAGLVLFFYKKDCVSLLRTRLHRKKSPPMEEKPEYKNS